MRQTKEHYVEIGLSANYVPKWGLWEGVRELIQNAKDREELSGKKMTIQYKAEKQTLFISNKDTTAPDDIWIFGYTKKENETYQFTKPRGKWGEGLKLGCLSIIRNKKRIAVFNNGYLYIPTIKESRLSKHPTLQIKRRAFKENINDFVVMIKGMSQEEWDQIKENFCFLSDKTKLISESGEELLTDPCESGKIYVDGIFVEQDANLLFGYNLKDVSLPRDRDYIYSHNKTQRIPKALADCSFNGETTTQIVEVMKQIILHNVIIYQLPSYHDVSSFYPGSCFSYLSSYFLDKPTASYCLFKEVLEQIVESKTLCASRREVEDLIRFKSLGLHVSSELYSLAEIAGYNNLYKTHFERKVNRKDIEIIEEEDLSSKQKKNLKVALGFVRFAIKNYIKDQEVFVTDFNKELSGLWKDNKVYIDFRVLENLGQTVECLVHEFSHQCGYDMTSDHNGAMSVLNVKIYDKLLRECGYVSFLG